MTTIKQTAVAAAIKAAMQVRAGQATKTERLNPCANCQSPALKMSAIRRRDGVWHLLIKCRACKFIMAEPVARADFDRVTAETFAAWNGQKVAA